jgi:ABC-type uncharacterized transport system ATPase subunit
VRLALEGASPAPGWLAELRGVDVVRRDATGAELELLPGAEPAATLADVLGRGETVSRFEVVEPTLEALFIELVGRPPDEEAAEMLPHVPMAEPAASSAPAGDPA